MPLEAKAQADGERERCKRRERFWGITRVIKLSHSSSMKQQKNVITIHDDTTIPDGRFCQLIRSVWCGLFLQLFVKEVLR